MNQFKKLTKVIVMMVILALVSPLAIPANTSVAQAATTIKLDKKSITLTAGKSTTLHVKGTKKKVTWSTSNKKIATVNKNGKVTAVTGGAITVTATVNKKKYSCKVKVVAAENKAVKNAPFDAKEEKFGKFSAVIPKDWTKTTIQENGSVVMAQIMPASADKTKGSSNVSVVIQDVGSEAPDYATITKPYLAEKLTAAAITTQLKQGGMDAVVTGFKTSDYITKLGTAFKTEYKADYKTSISTGSFNQVVYDLFVGTYLIEISIADNNTAVTPDVYKVGEYVLNSIQLTK